MNLHFTSIGRRPAGRRRTSVAQTIRSAGIGSQNACEFVALPPDEYFTRREKKFSPPPGIPTATCQYVPPACWLLIPTQANTRIPVAVAGTTLSGILKRLDTGLHR